MLDSEEENILNHPSDLVFEWPHYYRFDEVFIPKIFHVSELSENIKIPDDFNAVSMTLNGTLSSDLKWDAAISYARHQKALNKMLLWNLDLGLFDKLQFPLSNQPQFNALQLAIEHFMANVLPEFEDVSLGVCLWHHSFPLSEQVIVDDFSLHVFFERFGISYHEADPSLKQRFVFEERLEYIHALTQGISHKIKVFIALDFQAMTDQLHCCRLLSSSKLNGFQLILSGAQKKFSALSGSSIPSQWGIFSHDNRIDVHHTNEEPVNIALVLASQYKQLEKSHSKRLTEIIEILKVKRILFRVVSEDDLLAQWDGLDFLLCHADEIASESRRILQGFCAAGGTIVLLSATSLGCMNELSFDKWQEQLDFFQKSIELCSY